MYLYLKFLWINRYLHLMYDCDDRLTYIVGRTKKFGNVILLNNTLYFHYALKNVQSQVTVIFMQVHSFLIANVH